MKLVLTDSKLLKESIAIISELVTEARFVADKEGLSLLALDPATVAMVDFKLIASAFTEYAVDGSEAIALNLINFKQVLRRASPSDTIELETVEAKLKITIKGANTRTFHLPLIDMEDAKRQVPKVTYTATVVTRSEQLANAIEDADIVAESVALIADEKHLTVRAEGDLSKVNIEIPKDTDTKIVIEEEVDGGKVEQPIRARYSIEYLKKMISGAKLADKVELKFRADHPLRLEYKLLNKVVLAFILAPRVDND